MTLYEKVAARCAATDLPITAAGVRDVERYLKEERRACAYDRAGVVIVRQECAR